MVTRTTGKKFIGRLQSQFLRRGPLSMGNGTGRVVSGARRLAAATMAVLIYTGGLPAEEAEYSVKARFLVNFALYAYWPAPAFHGDTSPVNICLYRRDPFGRMLDEAVEARQYVVDAERRRNLNVWRAGTVAELTDCHVVFLSGVKVDVALIDRISAPYRLIVGDSGALIRSGGHIHVYRGEEGMEFEVNLDQIRRAQLGLSSQLLRLARIVSPAAKAGR